MTREEMIDIVGEYFDVESRDTEDYDWTSGCYHNGYWISLKSFVDFGMDLIDTLVDCYGAEIE